MQVIVEKRNNRVAFMFQEGAEVGLTETGLHQPISVLDVTSSEYEVVQAPENADFVGGMWGYNEDGWFVFDQPAWDNLQAARAEVAAKAARDIAKQVRELAVSQITVSTAAGNTFDGDETSQNRMARAILALQGTGTPATLWVLSDNSVIEATVAELAEALALSGAAQSALWVIA